MTTDPWATPAAPDVARAWYALHFPLGHPGQSGNPHRVIWTDWVEKARLAKEAAQFAAEAKARKPKVQISFLTGSAIPTMARNLDSGELTEYGSAKKAAKAIGVCAQTMDEAIKSGRHIVRNYRVWHAENPEPVHAVKVSPPRCTLENIETGEIVTKDSYSAMAEYIGCGYKNVQAFFKNGQIQVHGWRRPGDERAKKKQRPRRPIYAIDIETGERTDYPNTRQASMGIFTDEYMLSDIICGRNRNPKRSPARIYYADTGEVIFEPKNALDKSGGMV